jgi:hypothetical protein
MRLWELQIRAGSNPGRRHCRFRSVLVPSSARVLAPMYRLRLQRPGGYPVLTISTIGNV